jgi:hypothetical protein
MRIGWRLAREAYIAAVYPAGPEPIIRQFMLLMCVCFEIFGKGSEKNAIVQIFFCLFEKKVVLLQQI